ncbi:MAG: hypothetical protein AB8G22_05190 [Saprospiraceae bacterium]
MYKTKLYQTLLTLQTTEITAFQRFLTSPYFNQRTDVVAIMDLLKPYLLKEKEPPTDVEIYQTIYKSPFDDQKFRLLKSYLFKLLEQFFVVEEIFVEPLNVQLQLVKHYRRRELENAFTKSVKKLEQQLEKSPLRNAAYFNHRHQMLWEQHHFFFFFKPTEGQLLQASSTNIDQAYLTTKLQHLCLLATHHNVYDSQFETGFVNEILEYLRDSDLLELPSIAAYYFGYLLLTKPDEESHFQHFTKTLFEYGQQFPPQEIRVLYLMGINHAVRQKNRGQAEYIQALKDLYVEGLKNGYLFDETGKLSRFSYLNIITTGLQMQEYDWVEKIIYNYRDALDAQYRDSAFYFNLARLEYFRGNYDKALPLLQQSPSQNILLNLASKVILLKIYYELDEVDALYSHLDAMRNFIRRKKILGYHKVQHITLINYVQKLLKLNPFEKSAKQELRQAIQAEEKLMERDWLLAQIAS